MFCKKCGTELEDGTVYCPKCGADQTASDTETPAQPVNQQATPPPARRSGTCNRSGKERLL